MKAHWRAGGDMTTRDIVRKIAEIENDEDTSGEEDKVVPTFDGNRGVKNFVPSVCIDRDFAGASAATADTTNYSNGLVLPLEEDQPPSNSKTLPPSRGFGFVEFTEHAHALACLRELNNNVAYSSKFVAGGTKAIEIKRRIKNSGGLRKKQPMATTLGGDEGTKVEDFLGNDGRFKIPRLIVEFTVENKAKAKKQAERKALQFSNVMKQKKSARQSLLEEELKEDNDDKNGDDDVEKKVKQKKKKKSRGALQRERKRSKKEEGGEAALTDNDTACSNSALSSDTIKQTVCSTASQQKRDGVEREQQQQQPKKRKKKDVHPIMEVTPQTAIKPPKKKKKRTSKVEERDESAFEDMVRSYKKSLGGGGNRGDDIVVNTTIAKKNHVDGGAGRDSRNGRWFD